MLQKLLDQDPEVESISADNDYQSERTSSKTLKAVAVSLLLASICYAGLSYDSAVTNTQLHTTSLEVSEEFFDQEPSDRPEDSMREKIENYNHVKHITSEGTTLASSFFSASGSAGGALCTNPVVIGELHNLKSNQCADISGINGKGNLASYACDGYSDQEFILCGDGTIRNKARNFCLTAYGYNSNVASDNCNLLNGPKPSQKWKIGRRYNYQDYAGFTQKAFELLNQETNQCLDIAGRRGYGNFGTWRCDGYNDQIFYFKNKGLAKGSGRLINQQKGMCLDVVGRDGAMGRNVLLWNCDPGLDQSWYWWQNGEITNQKSNMCLDVSGSSGVGNVLLWWCDQYTDQLWYQSPNLQDGQFNSFVNKKSNICLDAYGNDGNSGRDVGTWKCEGAPDQRFRWSPKEWTKPIAQWKQFGSCNMHGSIKNTVTSSVSYGKSVTHEVGISVTATISAGVSFKVLDVNKELSVTASTSLAQTWDSSYSQSISTEVTCDTYDDGTKFTGGCMWRLDMQTNNVRNKKTLKWNTNIVRCTNKNVAPKCPPFTKKCTDKACKYCKNYL